MGFCVVNGETTVICKRVDGGLGFRLVAGVILRWLNAWNICMVTGFRLDSII